MTARKPLFVSWCPKDALDGMIALGPWEELAYRRTIDLIYVTNNDLPDDDKKMAWMTKLGIARWRKAKAVLTAGSDPKLRIIDGKIHNDRCDAELHKIVQYRKGQSDRAKASNEGRNPPEDNKTASADAGADAGAGTTAGTPLSVIRNLVSKKESAAQAPPEVVQINPAAVIFSQCVGYLRSKGLSEDRAKSIIGRWRKDYPDPSIIDAVTKAQAKADLVEPVSWITAVLKADRPRAAACPL